MSGSEHARYKYAEFRAQHFLGRYDEVGDIDVKQFGRVDRPSGIEFGGLHAIDKLQTVFAGLSGFTEDKAVSITFIELQSRASCIML